VSKQVPVSMSTSATSVGAEEPPEPTADQASAATRSTDARLARLHLRGGLLPLARAALEQMAGAGTLDRDAMADLAEVRWRSGDLEGAAESARAHVGNGGTEPIAVIVLAEDAARREQTAEADAAAAPIIERVGGAVDILFAGEARSAAWPAMDGGWMDTGATAPGRWGLLAGGSEVTAPTPETWQLAAMVQAAIAAPAAGRPAAGIVAGHYSGQPTASVVMSGRLAGEELEIVDRALADGQTAAAAERLGVLLRLDPALAPVILSAADKALASAPSGRAGLSVVHLVRGDAYRVLGRENEAAAAYQQAHQTLAPGSTAKGSQ
jgi:hypothetical protein